jgi:hypothetical protein
MDTYYDRRTFLRRAASAALGVPVVAGLACRSEAPQGRSIDEDTGGPREVTRPILLPWGSDAVLIASPPRERPVAYLSVGRMEIYVDRDFRDRLQYALGAHISVSTGHWRIRRPGDPMTFPVQPGDAEREYEEIDMRAWDASMEPVEGDARVMRGSAWEVIVTAECQPLSGAEAWLSGGPWALLRCGPPNGDLCREDLMEIGTATRYADRDCTQSLGPTRCLTWACREAVILAGA